MTMRQWSIVAILVFLNAFIFTILFILLRQVYLTPPEVAVATPTPIRTPAFTPLPTDTPTPLITPTPTNTRVVLPATPTPTFTPTFTPVPPTPTFTPAPPTPTSPPPTATPVPPTPTNTPTFTPTPTATPTPTPTLPYSLYETIRYENNCGHTWLDGTVWDASGAPQPNVRVRAWTYGNLLADKVTGYNPTSAGYYEFILDAVPPGPREVMVEVAIVDENGNLLSPKISAQTTATDCDNPNGRQRVIIDFIENP